MTDEEKDLRMEKLKAETDLIYIKLNQSREDMKHKHGSNHPFIKALSQSIVAGVVLASAFFFLFQPIINATNSINEETSRVAELKSEQASLEAKVEAEKNRLLKQANERESAALELENKQIKSKLEELVKASRLIEKSKENNILQAEKLESDLIKLKSEYDRLSRSFKSSEKDKNIYEDLAKKANIAIENYKKEIETIKINRDASKNRTADIEFQLKTLAIGGQEIIVVYAESRTDDALMISDRLRKAGAITFLQARDANVKNKLWYYPGMDKELAEQIRALVTDIQKLDIEFIDTDNDNIQIYLDD